MDFSDSYATGIQSIIVPNDSDIASPDDLACKKIGTQRGTTGYIYCSDDFGEDSVVAYDSGLTAVQALNNGQVDAVVIDNAPATEYVAANPGLKCWTPATPRRTTPSAWQRVLHLETGCQQGSGGAEG